MNGFRPCCVLSVHPSLNRPCHLKTRLLEIPLNMFVLFYIFGLPLVALSLPLTSPFSLGCKFNGQHLNVCHFQTDGM